MKYVIISILAVLLIFGCTSPPPVVNNTPIVNNTPDNQTQMYCVKICHIDVENPGNVCQLTNSKDQVCTMEYKIGDICLPTIDCQMEGSSCKAVNKNSFLFCALLRKTM